MSNNEFIYLREFVKDQCEFLQTQVVNHSKIGWIVGPPGTGKSTTSFLFAMQLNRSKWVITWLSFLKTTNPVATLFEDNEKRTVWLSGNITELTKQFDALISQMQTKANNLTRNHIVFIDGITQTTDHASLCKSCVSWIKKMNSIDCTNCRLVFVSSVASRSKTSKVHEDRMFCIEEFFVCSWTIDEYRSAFKNKDFRQSVLKYFDSSQYLYEEFSSSGPQNDLSNEKLEELLEELIVSKHYFAGGSSRFMFGMNTADVVVQLEKGMENLDDIQRYLKCEVGYSVKSFVHTLFGFYRNSLESFRHDVFFISEYLASALASKGGESYIQNIILAIGQNNPALQGWLLEINFFAAIKSNGFKYRERGKMVVQLFTGTISSFDPLNVESIPGEPVWLKPSKWNQGGYDAVYVDKDLGLVKIVQVTRSGTHKFKIEYFEKLLEILTCKMLIKIVEICFVVTADVSENFKISTVSGGQGLLKQYPGWESIHHEEDNVKVLVAEGITMPSANNTSTKGKGIIITANALHQFLQFALAWSYCSHVSCLLQYHCMIYMCMCMHHMYQIR